jgi:CheY-like chemotaxis protein
MPPVPPARRLSVLVVDGSNRDAADSLCLLLSLWGHRPFVTYDAASAWKVALRYRPDVVLLEVAMLGSDGWGWARRLLAEPSLRGTRVVAVTVCGRPGDRKKSHAAGLDPHLVKPVEPELLRDVLAGFAADGRPAADLEDGVPAVAEVPSRR